MRAAIVVLALLLSSPVAHAERKFKGKQVTIHYQQTSARAIVRQLTKLGGMNVAWLDGTDATIDVDVKRKPWDAVVADVLARAGLASRREGNVLVIGSADTIAARRTQRLARTGPRIDLVVSDATAAQVAELWSRAAGTPLVLDPVAPRRAQMLRLRRVPAGQARELLLTQTGATVLDAAAAPTAPAGCVAASTPARLLQVVGVATAWPTRKPPRSWALIVGPGGVVGVLGDGDCVGGEQLRARVTPTLVELGEGGTRVELEAVL